MKLNDKEARILSCVELQADLPLAKIAKETRQQEHSIRYYLKNLEERGIIQRAPFINVEALGYQFFGIFFSLRSDSTSRATEITNRLMEAKQVVWLAELGGDYQYGVAISAKHINEVQSFLFELSKDFPEIFFEKSIACQFQMIRFPRLYLNPGGKQQTTFSVAGPYPLADCDELDRKILSALAQHKPKSRRQLGQLIQVPLSTIDLRVKKLEEKKIIMGYVYQVDSSVYGMGSYTLLVYSKGLNKDFHDQLITFASQHPSIIALYACLGSWDYELNLEVSNNQEVVNISRQLTEQFPENISTIKVLSKFREIKFSYVPF